MKSNWTAADILAEAQRRCGGRGLMEALAIVTEEAFGRAVDLRAATYHFPAGDLTVGEIAAFFAALGLPPSMKWHQLDQATAFVAAARDDVAQAFARRFGVFWIPRINPRRAGAPAGRLELRGDSPGRIRRRRPYGGRLGTMAQR